MPGHKIVARFTDGRVLKGTTTNFNDAAPNFLLTPYDVADSRPTVVEMSLLKALYFVRSFAGDPERTDNKSFTPGQPYAGRRIKVVFKDGETLVGSAPTYSPEMPGFFVFPADPASNTLKVFALAGSVANVQWL
jgi:hypothetical protein